MALIRNTLAPRSHNDSSLMVRTADIWSWLSAHSQNFLTTSWFYATFSDVYAPSEHSVTGMLAQRRTGDQPAYSGFPFSVIWLAAVFVMRCCLILILLLPQALSLMPFPLTLVVGYIVVDMSQGLRLFAAFGFFLSLFRNWTRKKIIEEQHLVSASGFCTYT